MANNHSGFIALTPITLGTGGTAVGSAPLYFVSGSLLATPENGAVGYNGTHLYVSIGTIRYQLDQQTVGTANNNFARLFSLMGA